MYQLRKIDIGTVALYSFLMFLILSLIIFIPFGLIITILSTLVPSTGEMETEMFPFFGGIFLIVVPLFYAVIATIMNVLMALLYRINLNRRFYYFQILSSKPNELVGDV